MIFNHITQETCWAFIYKKTNKYFFFMDKEVEILIILIGYLNIYEVDLPGY